jgi:hypothetical protein
VPGMISTNAPKSTMRDLADVVLLSSGARGELFDDGDGLLRGLGRWRRSARGRRPRLDLAAGLLDDGADHLAAGSDDVADLVDGDPHRDDARRVGTTCRHGAPCRCLGHLAEDVQTGRSLAWASAGASPIGGRPSTLMSICKGGDALRRAGDLEVHVAVVIFLAGDVGEDDELARRSMTRPMATPATGALRGTPASIIESEFRRRPRPSTTSRSTRGCPRRCGSV